MRILLIPEGPPRPFGRARKCFLAVLLACAVGAGCAAGALALSDAEAPVAQFVRELEESYHDVRSLKAEFSQTYQWGNRARAESGTVYFARGGRMRWDYRQPDAKLFVSNGKQVFLYIPAEKQATVSSVKASEDYRVPFRLLLSRLDLGKVFAKIEDAPGALPAQDDDRVLRATPKHGDRSGVHQVLMEISPQFDIRRLTVVYTDNSRMEFTFDHIQRNVPSKPELFEFHPPPGTEVIEER